MLPKNAPASLKLPTASLPAAIVPVSILRSCDGCAKPFDTLRAQSQILEPLCAQREFLRDLRAHRTAILEELGQAACGR